MEEFDIENFPASASAKNMLHSVSEDFYEKSYVMKWLLQVMGLEWDDALNIIGNELVLQFFVETATWGLRYHEEKWQLPVRENLSYEERRKLIYAKRDFKAPMTPYMMEQYMEQVLPGTRVYVLDCHDPGEFAYVPEHPNIFRVLFETGGTLDTRKAKEILDQLKQSHTTYLPLEELVKIYFTHNFNRIVLENVKICVRMPFWECKFLDGSLLLDGSARLGSRADYKLVSHVAVGFRIPVRNNVSVSLEVQRNLCCLDGSVNLDGTKKLDAYEQKEDI